MKRSAPAGTLRCFLSLLLLVSIQVNGKSLLCAVGALLLYYAPDKVCTHPETKKLRGNTPSVLPQKQLLTLLLWLLFDPNVVVNLYWNSVKLT
jgi:hypothetical protein